MKVVRLCEHCRYKGVEMVKEVIQGLKQNASIIDAIFGMSLFLGLTHSYLVQPSGLIFFHTYIFLTNTFFRNIGRINVHYISKSFLLQITSIFLLYFQDI